MTPSENRVTEEMLERLRQSVTEAAMESYNRGVLDGLHIAVKVAQSVPAEHVADALQSVVEEHEGPKS